MAKEKESKIEWSTKNIIIEYPFMESCKGAINALKGKTIEELKEKYAPYLNPEIKDYSPNR